MLSAVTASRIGISRFSTVECTAIGEISAVTPRIRPMLAMFEP